MTNNVELRVCRVCNIEKILNDENFYCKIDGNKKYFNRACKDCVKNNAKIWVKQNPDKFQQRQEKNKDQTRQYMKEYNQVYYAENKEQLLNYQKEYSEINPEKIKERQHKYYEKNKEIVCDNVKLYRKENKEKVKKQRANYYQNNKEMIIKNVYERKKKKLKLDPEFKFRESFSQLFRSYLKRKRINKTNSCFKLLGYTIIQLRNHIELLFKPWMTWSNQGAYNPNTWDDNDPTTWKWQLDHIIPHSTFHYTSTDDEDFKKCWALSNLRPYSAKQN